MKTEVWPELRKYAIGEIRKLINGEKAMPEVRYEEREYNEIHASDLDDVCRAKPIFRRIIKDSPGLSDKAILRFLRGRIFERAVATELEPIEVDGVILRPDGDIPEFGLIEIKSTATGCEYFNPHTSFPWWIERCKSYCYAYKREEMGLIVLFLAGNMPDYTVWMMKKHKGTPKNYTPIRLDAWKLIFEDIELKTHWIEIQRRKRLFQDALTSGTPLPSEEIKDVPEWMHKDCEFALMCPYQNGFLL